MTEQKTKFPLDWPVGYPRKKYRSASRFKNNSFGRTRDEVFRQLEMMLDYNERKSIVMSTNIPLRNDGIPYANYRQPEDKDVAVYFNYKKKQVVLCCDEYNKIEDNLWAIAKTVEAMRGIERWGVSEFLERSFTGFNALPPKQEEAPKKQWWDVLRFAGRPGASEWFQVEAKYIELAKQRHPDTGGSVAAFQELNEAFQMAKKHYGR